MRRRSLFAAVTLLSLATASVAQEHEAAPKAGGRVSVVPPKPSAVSKDDHEAEQARPAPTSRYVPSKPGADAPRRGTVVSQPDPPAPVRGKTAEHAASTAPEHGVTGAESSALKEKPARDGTVAVARGGHDGAPEAAKASDEAGTDKPATGAKPAPRNPSLQERIAKRIAALQAAREAKNARPDPRPPARPVVTRESPARRVKLDWNTALSWPAELTRDLDVDRDRARR